MKKLFFIMLLLIPMITVAQQEVPFTIEERLNSINGRIDATNQRITSLEKQLNERIHSTNERITSLEKQMDVRFEAVEAKINTIFVLTLFVLGALVSMFGFILWDRRSVIKPVRDDLDKIAENNSRIISALKEQAKTNPQLAEILKNTGIL